MGKERFGIPEMEKKNGYLRFNAKRGTHTRVAIF
jgi:hypothetical protein